MSEKEMQIAADGQPASYERDPERARAMAEAQSRYEDKIIDLKTIAHKAADLIESGDDKAHTFEQRHGYSLYKHLEPYPDTLTPDQIREDNLEYTLSTEIGDNLGVDYQNELLLTNSQLAEKAIQAIRDTRKKMVDRKVIEHAAAHYDKKVEEARNAQRELAAKAQLIRDTIDSL